MPTTTANLDAIKAGGWPYWATDDGSIVLVNADCLEVLPVLSGIDAVVTDPPYGISYRNNRDRDLRKDKSYDSELRNDDTGIGQEAIDWAFDASIPCCTFASPMKAWNGRWRQFLVWDKGPAVGGGGDIATCWKFTWELVQVGGFGALTGNRDSAVLRYWIGQCDLHSHPTEKPVELMEYLIKKLVSGVVLDPFTGGGTTGVACVRLGRHFIGIELEPRYYRIAIDRIKKELGRMRLFEKPPAITQRELAI